jgi:hypothetical protein
MNRTLTHQPRLSTYQPEASRITTSSKFWRIQHLTNERRTVTNWVWAVKNYFQQGYFIEFKPVWVNLVYQLAALSGRVDQQTQMAFSDHPSRPVGLRPAVD